MRGSAPGRRRSRAAPTGCVADAGRPRPWRGAPRASRAWRSAARPTAPAMRRARQRGNPMAARTRKRNGGAAAPRAGGASRRGARQGSAPGAGTIRRTRAGRPARRAATSARRRNGSSMRNGAPPGLCTRCGGPVFDGLSRCGPCTVIDERSRSPERKNARSRRLYAERRDRGLCTSCGAPSQGDSRCAPCAEKSYHGSAHFRGIPVWDPSWTVIELETGREHGPFDSEGDVALCLAFEKLDPEPGRGAVRRLAHGFLHVLDLTGPPASRGFPCSAAGPPPAGAIADVLPARRRHRRRPEAAPEAEPLKEPAP